MPLKQNPGDVTVYNHALTRLLITGGGRFPQILDLFQGLKIEAPNGCLEKTSIFKIIMIDDVTLWSELESKLTW